MHCWEGQRVGIEGHIISVFMLGSKPIWLSFLRLGLNSNGMQCKALILKTNSLALFTARLREFQKTLQMKLCEMEISENKKYSEQRQTKKA